MGSVVTPLSPTSGCFSRQLFEDGERLLIISRCQVCGKAHTASCYDGSLQQWESGHRCEFRPVNGLLDTRS